MSEQQKQTPSNETTPGTEQQAKQAAPEPSQQAVARMIADRLGETQGGPQIRLKLIVKALGRTQARALLEETLQIPRDAQRVASFAEAASQNHSMTLLV